MNSFFRRNRRSIADLIHAILAAGALAAAFLLRFDFTLAPPYPRMLLASLPLLLAVKLAVFRLFGLRELAWRYLVFGDLLRLAASNLAASLAAVAVLRLFIGSAFPRSIHVIDLLACTALLTAGHAAAKLCHEALAASPKGQNARKRVAIYGAGQAGAMLAAEIHANPETGFEAVAFLDDDPLKRGLRIHGLRVLGGLEQLPAAVRELRVDAVLLAMPAVTGTRLSAILEDCQTAGVSAKRVPSLSEVQPGRALVRDLREVRLEDLLGRCPVDLGTQDLGARLEGLRVLVTGAGGSIGSELCRQIARHSPAALIGFDHAETALYEIDRELRARYPQLIFHPEIGSIQNPRRLEELFRQHAPQSVYHAAAYKHVPLMEAQLFEAVENNIFGTRNVARAASDFAAREFVLISSDKAVRPANVMGATKRLAEMVIQAMAHAGPTRFLAVRFGNVLGSSGSVIPVFREQIARGGPLTVTHPEMQRFFMTIPEAAALVLEAAALGSRTAGSGGGESSGGEIFVLEMGRPVRILDLARHLILLSGLQPGRDIAIEFTGIRPGEKLHEELSAHEESTLPTPHSQIRIFSSAALSARELARGLDQLRAASENSDAAAVVLCLQKLVPGYHPSSFLLRRALEEKARGAYA
jgi:FlaA1/EpsC-like NDP-sugar epimerase